MRIFNEDVGLHVKSWCEHIEQGALDQIFNLSQLPFARHHIAIMPDCHQGYGMPIGGVLATEGVIIPNAVGVDIGCGMCVSKSNVFNISKDTLKLILKDIREAIPVGFEHRNESIPEEMPYLEFVPDDCDRDNMIVFAEYDSATRQLGTLGGGNHFIEIQRDEDNRVYVMIHSGSRNLGYKVARHYNDMAKELNKVYYSSVNPKWDLAFLPAESKEASAYLYEHNYAVEFASQSRYVMMGIITKIFAKYLEFVEFEEPIEAIHNYVNYEKHFGKYYWVHRKGATKAFLDDITIIPGSQGTNSYIGRGLGNPDSFKTCSHGAGRQMGRKVAKNTLDLAYEQGILDSQGILHSIRGKDNLDEAPSAYKNINDVMEAQKDLVEITTKLTPLAVIKG